MVAEIKKLTGFKGQLFLVGFVPGVKVNTYYLGLLLSRFL